MPSKKLLLPVVLSLSLLSGCFEADTTTAIETVRKDASSGQSNEALVRELAGESGRVIWGGQTLDDDRDAVTATVSKVIDGVERELVLQYSYDRQTKQVILDKVYLDGQMQSVFDGALAMLAMRLE